MEHVFYFKMKREGLVEKVGRGEWKLTPKGLDVITKKGRERLHELNELEKIQRVKEMLKGSRRDKTTSPGDFLGLRSTEIKEHDC